MASSIAVDAISEILIEHFFSSLSLAVTIALDHFPLRGEVRSIVQSNAREVGKTK